MKGEMGSSMDKVCVEQLKKELLDMIGKTEDEKAINYLYQFVKDFKSYYMV